MNENMICLSGRCSHKPELKTVQFDGGESCYCIVNLYTNSHTKKQQANSDIDYRHRCVFRGKMAKSFVSRIGDNKYVSLKGHVRYRTFQDENGADKRISEIIVERFTLPPKEKVTDTFMDNIKALVHENPELLELINNTRG